MKTKTAQQILATSASQKESGLALDICGVLSGAKVRPLIHTGAYVVFRQVTNRDSMRYVHSTPVEALGTVLYCVFTVSHLTTVMSCQSPQQRC